MSFSSKLKNEIASASPRSACCRRAFLSGVLFAKAKALDSEIYFNLENDSYAEFVSEIIKEVYGNGGRIEKKGGRCRTLSFHSKSAIKYLSSLNDSIDPVGAKCQGCEVNFLRGVFFASGRISDPEKQYLLEFSPINHPLIFTEILVNSGIDIKCTQRRGETVFYIKKSSLIEDFLALVGLNSAAFELMNAKIEGELRNNANRVANCDSNNIDRSVNASHRQFYVLDALVEANLLSSLPEELEKTAKLKLANRDLSLSQLAAISVPAISKSGLSHRLNRIIEIAEELMPGLKK